MDLRISVRNLNDFKRILVFNGSSRFVFVCPFLPLSNNLLGLRSQTCRHNLDFTICHPFYVKDICDKIDIDIVVAFKEPPTCNEFEERELKIFNAIFC